MGIAVSFKLLKLEGTVATYGYGKDFDNFDGVIKIDLCRHSGDDITVENEQDIRFDIVTPCKSEWKDYGLAGRVFVRIFRHYKEHSNYPEKGSHYAG
ncbi:hypothetical protein O9H85_36055 [Paenibacillus filicis]|uniref:Uncharacterized protein n=1 Tax=Paenibacillus gyeongsangnamensis TaxID=3388067 RepID=A0ABT4QLA5_9BACL|nr:hypothetical protein [Paenibacillus filicis]MCZ8517646.1 hypothetical protein [Paenibacillus filicis]